MHASSKNCVVGMLPEFKLQLDVVASPSCMTVYDADMADNKPQLSTIVTYCNAASLANPSDVLSFEAKLRAFAMSFGKPHP